MTAGHHPPAGRPAENTIAGTAFGASLQAHTVNGNVVFSQPPTLTPAQLRAPSPFFTNRTQELAKLTELLGPAESGPPTLAVISGVGGSGKTALVLHWAHSILHRFTHGQFFVDLRGFSGDRSGPLEPRTVLERFLRALGVHPDYMPSDVEELATLWRTIIAGQRVLIVADNAASAQQVRPLLPGSGPATLVVTTRLRLPDLAMDGARSLDLGPLDDRSSLALLDRLVGSARLRSDPQAASSLVTHSGRLPLTLYALGAHLGTHPDRRIAALAEALQNQRPARTENDMDDTKATLDVLYDALSRDEQVIYRLIGELPGHDFTVETIAELAGIDWLEAEMANLIAVQQMAYEAGLHVIACNIVEALWGLFVYRRPHGMWLKSCDIGYQAALAWGDLKAQARVLEAFGAAYQSKQDWLTAEEYFRRALVLEEQADHLQGAATALEGIGVSQLGLGQHDRALAYFLRSLGYHLALKRSRGARLQQRHISQVHLATGRYRDAIAAIEEGRRYPLGPAEEYLEGGELLFEGSAYLGAGDLDRAEQILSRALSIAHLNATEQEQATVSVALADLASARGDHDHELHLLQQAQTLYARLGLPQTSQVQERIESIQTTDEQ